MTTPLQIATRAARAAGKVLVEKFNSTREIHSKGKRDIVTDADYAAEAAVRETLMGRFPDDLFISEEGSAAERQALWAQLDRDPALCAWIVDPLDGTTNYARHQPVFTVSIARYCRGAVQVGVVFDPVRNELFAAERGHGATVNGTPLHVSPVEKFEDAVLGMEWARAQPLRRRTGELLVRMAARATTARCTGSAALSLCYVAAARFDAYYHLYLAPWDVAAGALVVEEAGGRVTDPDGKPWTVHSQAYVATNGHLHPAVRRYFRS